MIQHPLARFPPIRLTAAELLLVKLTALPPVATVGSCSVQARDFASAVLFAQAPAGAVEIEEPAMTPFVGA